VSSVLSHPPSALMNTTYQLVFWSVSQTPPHPPPESCPACIVGVRSQICAILIPLLATRNSQGFRIGKSLGNLAMTPDVAGPVDANVTVK
jgi:hypothetical protein